MSNHTSAPTKSDIRIENDIGLRNPLFAYIISILKNKGLQLHHVETKVKQC